MNFWGNDMTTDTTQPQAYLPALQRLYAPLAPYAYPFIRFVVGAIIARHGYPKIFAGGVNGLSGLLSGKMGLDPGPGLGLGDRRGRVLRWDHAGDRLARRGWRRRHW